MGWLRDVWKKTTTWVREKIVEPVVDWFEELIHDTTVAIRIWKHEFHKLLAKWLENDWVFLGLVAATVAAAILWPKITTWIGKITLVKVFKEAWKDVEEGFASILDFIHIIEIDAINTILKVFWPEWKAMMGQLADVTSALAAELGKGTEYLHAYFSVIHGISIVEHSILGIDPKLSEMSALEDTSRGLQKIDEKFWAYAENPALIVPDIIDDFYLPRAENIGKAQSDLLDSVRDNRDKIVGINDSLHDFESRLKHFLELTPKDLQDIMSERLQPIIDSLDDVLFVVDTEIMPRLETAISTFEKQFERQEQINERLRIRLDDPYSLLLQNELFGEDDRRALQDYIAELNKRSLGEETAESGPLASEFVHGVLEGLKRSVPPGEPPMLSFEAPRIPLLPGEPSARQRDWFVGEF